MSESTTLTPKSQPPFLDPIPYIIPFGSLCYMAGASGTGKTIIMAEWLARMRDGKTICGHPTNKPTGFYYLAADRDWSTYADAFRCAGFPTVNRYVLAEDKDFSPSAWKRTESFKFLTRCLNLLDPIPGSLVIIDPVAPLFVQGKTNDNWDVAISSHYFRQEARQRQITLVCMANVAKQKAEDSYERPQDRIAGSGAFVAYSDTQIYLSRDKEGILTLGWVPRRYTAEEFRFEFNPVTFLFQPARGLNAVSGMTEELSKILNLIPANGITSPELVRHATTVLGISRATIFRALKNLDERFGLINRSTHGFLTHRPVAATGPTTP